MTFVVNIINNIFHGKLKHLSRFGAVGFLNTLVDFITFTIFNEFIGFGYIISQILGYSFGIVNSFIFNRKWTFEDRDSNKKTFEELLQFIVVNLISLAITLLSMNILVKSLSINVYISKIIVTIVAQVTNFLCYKLWVFR